MCIMPMRECVCVTPPSGTSWYEPIADVTSGKRNRELGVSRERLVSRKAAALRAVFKVSAAGTVCDSLGHSFRWHDTQLPYSRHCTDFCTRETLWLWSQPSPAPTEASALKVGEFLLLALAPLSQSGINTKVTTMTTASFKDCTRFRSWSVCTWISLVQAAVRTAYALLWRQLNNKTSLNNCYCYCENKCCVEDF